MLVGLAGFAVTGTEGFAHHDTDKALLGFELNPLHNIVHIALGALGLFMWRRLDMARTYGWVVVVSYVGALALGLVTGEGDEANILSLNAADDVLHVLFILGGLAAALLPTMRRDNRGGARA
jgi:hypothetical protein